MDELGVSVCVVGELVTYAFVVGDDGGEGVVAYAAVAVDCDGLFAGVDGACAGVCW